MNMAVLRGQQFLPFHWFIDSSFLTQLNSILWNVKLVLAVFKRPESARKIFFVFSHVWKVKAAHPRSQHWNRILRPEERARERAREALKSTWCRCFCSYFTCTQHKVKSAELVLGVTGYVLSIPVMSSTWVVKKTPILREFQKLWWWAVLVMNHA